MGSSGETAWMRGVVKAVPSGDSILIMGNVKAGPPPEKTITLSSLIAPKLARRDGKDEPFAWASREYLRKKCIGKDVIFKVDYKVDQIQREFGTVFLGDVNLAVDVVSQGWAKVRPSPSQGPSSPYISQLLNLEETAKTQEVGIWSKDPSQLAASVRNLPPSSVGQDSGLDAMELLESNKGKSLPAIVEQVRDGSTLRVFLLPSFHFVQVYLAGIQCPSAGRRFTAAPAEAASEAPNGDSVTADPAKPQGGPGPSPSSIAQKLAAGLTLAESGAEPYGIEAKHYTEVRCLNREVRVVLEGVDGRHSNLVGSVYYPDGDTPVNIAPLLVKEGLAKVVEWSAESLEQPYKAQLKSLELEAKRSKLRIWTGFVPQPSNSTAVKDDNFSGTVIEVVSGDCIIVADSSSKTERRVNLSSIRSKKLGNPRSDQKPEPFAREAKEFLRQRLIGQKVEVSMEYTRKITAGEGREPGPSEGRSMEFGSVLLQGKGEGEGSGSANLAEMVVVRGLASVIRHRDFEERSAHYEALLAAEARAIKSKKGIHSGREPPVSHINDLSTQASTQKARGFLPFLQKTKRMPAVVDYVLSGHRFKLIVPKEMCAIAFSLAGVRCPARGEQYSEEAIAFMRHRIMQQDVEIEVETVDKTGTFIGSLWCGKTNVSLGLLDAGLAKLHPSFSPERTADGAALISAEKRARDARVKVWESYVEAEVKASDSAVQLNGGKRREEVIEVEVVHVLPAGQFYAVPTTSSLPAIESQLKELSQSDKPPPAGTFLPKVDDKVVALFSGDNSWTRALVVNVPSPSSRISGSSLYEVFYIDYGNQESVPLSKLRPLPAALAQPQGAAVLCQLALIQVPVLEDEFGYEAAEFLSSLTVGHKFVARVEERDNSSPKVKGQGTGPVLHVTLVDPKPSEGAPALSINAQLLQEGYASLVKRERRDNADRRAALDNLAQHQEIARKARLNIWQYGDIDDDEEDVRAPRGGRR